MEQRSEAYGLAYDTLFDLATSAGLFKDVDNVDKRTGVVTPNSSCEKQLKTVQIRIEELKAMSREDLERLVRKEAQDQLKELLVYKEAASLELSVQLEKLLFLIELNETNEPPDSPFDVVDIPDNAIVTDLRGTLMAAWSKQSSHVQGLQKEYSVKGSMKPRPAEEYRSDELSDLRFQEHNLHVAIVDSKRDAEQCEALIEEIRCRAARYNDKHAVDTLSTP